MRLQSRKYLDIYFDKVKHQYFLGTTKQFVPSVTGITKLYAGQAKVGRLQGWAAGMAADYVLDRTEESAWGLGDLDGTDIVETRTNMRKAAINAHKLVFKDSGIIGTGVHNAICRWEGFDDEYSNKDLYAGIPLSYIEQVTKCFEKYQQWKAGWEDDYEVVECEGLIGNNLVGYAGTFDMLLETSDGFELIDFKTRDRVYEAEDSLQLSAYAHAYEYCTGEKIVRARLVRLSKTGIKVPDDFVIERGDMDKHYLTFQALRQVYHWLHNEIG